MAQDPYSEVLQPTVATIRAASALAAKDVKFHASVDHELGQRFESSGQKLLELANRLLSQGTSKQSEPVLEFGESAAVSGGSWKRVSDALDVFFEKADLAMDEMKRPRAVNEFLCLNDSSDAGLNAVVHEKPQIHFKVPVDNTEMHPFIPKLSEKPHAMKPLHECLNIVEDEAAPPHYEQPYLTEIMKSEYPGSIMTKVDPQPPTDWNQTSAIWVDTVEVLNKMRTDLEQASEIAVDLEHHDLRTYYGITCLMQISTRDQDWVVDTIALRDDLSSLNTVFANPNIVKIFHGANMDIIWLQRDLGLYIVSLFDTYFASKALGFPKFSLAYLLETFAKFKTSKKYQLADWRIRPLPSVMMDYARADTHFLLFIYDQLRNKLIDADPAKLTHVLEESRKVASRRYEYVKFRPPTAFNSGMFKHEAMSPGSFIKSHNIPLAKQDLVRQLFDWRDNLARTLDESPRYIMANRVMLNICCLNAPITSNQISSCFTNFSKILRENLEVLTSIVQQSVTVANETESKASNYKAPREFQVNAKSISQLADLYSMISENTAQLKPDARGILENSHIFSGVLLSPLFSVQVPSDNSKPKFVEASELKERLETLSSIREMPLEQIEVPFTEPKQTEDISIVEVPEEIDEPEITPEIKDEVITLIPRKSNSNSSQKKQKKKPAVEEPKLDYSSLETKVLGMPDPKIKKKKRSYEQFKPSDSDAPQPFKGRKVTTQGKSTSFVKKRS